MIDTPVDTLWTTLTHSTPYSYNISATNGCGSQPEIRFFRLGEGSWTSVLSYSIAFSVVSSTHPTLCMIYRKRLSICLARTCML